FALDGSTASVIVHQSSSLNVQSLTIDAWIYPTDDILQPIVEYSPDVGWAGIHLWMGSGWNGALSGALWVNLRDINVGDHVLETPGGYVPLFQWSFVAATYDAATGLGTLYLNGQIVDQGFLGYFTPQTATKLRIGERPAGCY